MIGCAVFPWPTVEPNIDVLAGAEVEAAVGPPKRLNGLEVEAAFVVVVGVAVLNRLGAVVDVAADWLVLNKEDFPNPPNPELSVLLPNILPDAGAVVVVLAPALGPVEVFKPKPPKTLPEGFEAGAVVD